MIHAVYRISSVVDRCNLADYPYKSTQLVRSKALKIVISLPGNIMYKRINYFHESDIKN